MIAVAGVSVNHDGRGGTAPDPLVWDQGGPEKARKLGSLVWLFFWSWLRPLVSGLRVFWMPFLP